MSQGRGLSSCLLPLNFSLYSFMAIFLNFIANLYLSDLFVVIGF